MPTIRSGERRLPKVGTLTILLVLGACLRLVASIVEKHSFYHFDELYQYFEQAHRFTFGQGLVPWEWRYGIRSWLLPILLSGPMWVGDILSPTGDLHYLLPRLTAALFSLGVVWGGYVLGRAISPRHAIVTAFVAAVWFELVLFGAHVLSESLSFTALLLGVGFMSDPARNRSSLAGAALAMSAILRFQYLPAIAVVALLHRASERRWISFLVGGAAIAALSAGVDLYMGQWPFHWFFENVQQNLVNKRSENYGVSPAMAYVGDLGRAWSLWILPVIVSLAVIGARRYPVLFVAAVVNLLFHMLIPHKEYRFIFLTSGIFVLLAAIGSVDVLELLLRRFPIFPPAQTTAAALLLWGLVSAALFAGYHYVGRLAPNYALVKTVADARALPGLCGIVGYQRLPWRGLSYAVLHRPVPMYNILPASFSGLRSTPAVAMATIAPSANALIAPLALRADLPPAYQRVSCYSGDVDLESPICLFVRAGGCDPRNSARSGAYEVNRQLVELDH
ncbi:MAG TPA: hypothetical protein VEZ48_05600 [Sphingomonadaceae bacterium]|nr:hypothetical protein [Sphingomonadaceae bacterium]